MAERRGGKDADTSYQRFLHDFLMDGDGSKIINSNIQDGTESPTNAMGTTAKGSNFTYMENTRMMKEEEELELEELLSNPETLDLSGQQNDREGEGESNFNLNLDDDLHSLDALDALDGEGEFIGAGDHHEIEIDEQQLHHHHQLDNLDLDDHSDLDLELVLGEGEEEGEADFFLHKQHQQNNLQEDEDYFFQHQNLHEQDQEEGNFLEGGQENSLLFGRGLDSSFYDDHQFHHHLPPQHPHPNQTSPPPNQQLDYPPLLEEGNSVRSSLNSLNLSNLNFNNDEDEEGGGRETNYEEDLFPTSNNPFQFQGGNQGTEGEGYLPLKELEEENRILNGGAEGGYISIPQHQHKHHPTSGEEEGEHPTKKFVNLSHPASDSSSSSASFILNASLLDEEEGELNQEQLGNSLKLTEGSEKEGLDLHIPRQSSQQIESAQGVVEECSPQPHLSKAKLQVVDTHLLSLLRSSTQQLEGLRKRIKELEGEAEEKEKFILSISRDSEVAILRMKKEFLHEKEILILQLREEMCKQVEEVRQSTSIKEKNDQGSLEKSEFEGKLSILQGELSLQKGEVTSLLSERADFLKEREAWKMEKESLLKSLTQLKEEKGILALEKKEELEVKAREEKRLRSEIGGLLEDVRDLKVKLEVEREDIKKKEEDNIRESASFHGISHSSVQENDTTRPLSVLLPSLTTILVPVLNMPPSPDLGTFRRSLEMLVEHTLGQSKRIGDLEEQIKEGGKVPSSPITSDQSTSTEQGKLTTLSSLDDFQALLGPEILHLVISLLDRTYWQPQKTNLESTHKTLQKELGEKYKKEFLDMYQTALEGVRKEYEGRWRKEREGILKEREGIIKEKGKAQEDFITMKEKYLQTLKQLREELSQSKQNSWARLEGEWVKRKNQLGKEWQSRLELVLDHCKTNHQGCRCVQLLGERVNKT